MVREMCQDGAPRRVQEMLELMLRNERKRGQDSILFSFSLVSAKIRVCLEPNESVLLVRCFMC